MAVPCQVPVVIVPTDARLVAVVKAERVVSVAFDVATKEVAIEPPEFVPVTSPVRVFAPKDVGLVQVIGLEPPPADVNT